MCCFKIVTASSPTVPGQVQAVPHCSVVSRIMFLFLLPVPSSINIFFAVFRLSGYTDSQPKFLSNDFDCLSECPVEGAFFKFVIRISDFFLAFLIQMEDILKHWIKTNTERYELS